MALLARYQPDYIKNRFFFSQVHICRRGHIGRSGHFVLSESLRELPCLLSSITLPWLPTSCLIPNIPLTPLHITLLPHGGPAVYIASYIKDPHIAQHYSSSNTTLMTWLADIIIAYFDSTPIDHVSYSHFLSQKKKKKKATITELRRVGITSSRLRSQKKEMLVKHPQLQFEPISISVTVNTQSMAMSHRNDNKKLNNRTSWIRTILIQQRIRSLI
ncbi:hypothetical protein CLU79DRAFT_503510 [Phycomyces nitens]|nr:hypothetical protein CLU79DRAFT_503510 [Phycomyces nitens]